MTDRYRQRPNHPENLSNRPPHDSEVHPAYAPGRGYTPPLGSPPPKTFFERVVYSVRNYFGLQRRARASSMQWWLLKFVQGLLIATPLGVIGIGLVIGGSVSDTGQCISGIGKAAVLASALVFLWYALAPVTQSWHVMIPEGEYWAVEDSNHYTIAFLRGGSQSVDWHWNVNLVSYVDFMRVTQHIRIDGVLVTSDQRVSLDVHALMHFDPTRAPQENYPELRKMTRPELFQHHIDQHVRRVMLNALQRRSAQDRAYLLDNPSDLEDIIQWSLDELVEWGLLPVPGHPVSIQVISVPLPGVGPIAPPAARTAPPQPYTYDGPRQREIPTQPGTGPVPAQSASDPAPNAETVIPGAASAHDPDSDHVDSPPDQSTSTSEDSAEWVDPLDRRRNEKKKRRGEH